MARSRNQKFVMLLFVAIFGLGFLFGYFIQGSTIETTESSIEKVREDLDSLQLESLLLAQSPGRSCPVLSASAGESSAILYQIVNELRETNPDDPRFGEIKREADVLSIKSWLLSNAIEDQCEQNITTILLIYEEECEECILQDSILQGLKNGTVLVYSIDLNTDHRIVNTIKRSYGIETVPSIIIRGNVYGFLTEEELLDRLGGK